MTILAKTALTIDIEALYRAYGPAVLRRCRYLLGDEAASRDAMHDVFVELLRRHDILHDRGLVGLLLTTATNLCLNRLRAKGRRPEILQSDLPERLFDIANMSAVEDRILAQCLLNRVFGHHRKDTRLIATLYYVDCLTLDEVAREVGMSVSGVRKRLRSLRATWSGGLRSPPSFPQRQLGRALDRRQASLEGAH